MKATTALRKIAGLSKRIKGIQGGQGAGKTVSIVMLIINHCLKHEDQEVFIVSAELTKMRSTVIKDFKKIMKSFGIFVNEDFKGGTYYEFPNGSFIKFMGLDKDDIGKGLRCDLVYFNEANKTDFETYREISSRAAQVIIDFNPNEVFWFHTEVQPRSDCDFLILTFEDNEYLPAYEREEILSYFDRGYNEDGTIKSRYWANKWKVYGLGHIASLEGLVFENWTKYKELPTDIHLDKLFGIDWGGNDPTTFNEINISKKERKCYIRQIIYTPQISNAKLIDTIWKENPNNRVVVCDHRPDKIYELQMAGIMAVNAIKGSGSKLDQIEAMQEYDLFIHEDSHELMSELEKYHWVIDKKTGKSTNTPVDKDDHAIDGSAYPIRYYHKNY